MALRYDPANADESLSVCHAPKRSAFGPLRFPCDRIRIFLSRGCTSHWPNDNMPNKAFPNVFNIQWGFLSAMNFRQSQSHGMDKGRWAIEWRQHLYTCSIRIIKRGFSRARFDVRHHKGFERLHSSVPKTRSWSSMWQEIPDARDTSDELWCESNNGEDLEDETHDVAVDGFLEPFLSYFRCITSQTHWHERWEDECELRVGDSRPSFEQNRRRQLHRCIWLEYLWSATGMQATCHPCTVR